MHQHCPFRPAKFILEHKTKGFSQLKCHSEHFFLDPLYSKDFTKRHVNSSASDPCLKERFGPLDKGSLIAKSSDFWQEVFIHKQVLGIVVPLVFFRSICKFLFLINETYIFRPIRNKERQNFYLKKKKT